MTKEDSKKKLRKKELESIINNGIEGKDYVTCKICGYKSTNISTHVTRKHKMTADEYRKLLNVEDKLFCQNSRDKFSLRMYGGNPNDNPDSIEKMKKTKASTKEERSNKAKTQFSLGERKVPDNSGRGIYGIRHDLGHNCRSMWEANIARILKLKGIKYEFEYKTYSFYDNEDKLIDSYLPDFYLPKYNAYLEVKGQMDKISIRKLELFKKEGYRVIIIDDILYNWLIKRYKNILGKKIEISGRNIKTHPHLFKGDNNE